jgi:alkanesulfonate monooxygenase SsuD/methylene tetrahydromethanopterin reductase-like flavin-dependent oxidoreductase (luciferase family)
MKVGVDLIMQNVGDWDRFLGRRFGSGPREADHDMWYEDLALGELVEDLGFDSLWTTEHHFTPYNLIPDPLQTLTWHAARTKRLELGTCVIVLPWHDPVRVAEQIALLDVLTRGRRLMLGFGRGLGRVEYEGFRVPMAEARDRFAEAFEVVRRALTQERFTFEGRFHRIPEMSIRPLPRTPNLLDDAYMAANSPESVGVAADLDLGLLIIPQKPWELHAEDMALYRAARAKRGKEMLPAIVLCFPYCAATEAEARDGATRYIGAYQRSLVAHYELDEPEHFKSAKVYEYYANAAAQMQELRKTAGESVMRDFFVGMQPWGTPEQVLTKLREIKDKVDAAELICIFKTGGMPPALAERSMRLFAEEVLPELHRW